MNTPDRLIQPGIFVVGCNYWASHAGTAMWSDWRPDVVKADLAQLAREGMQVLRVFPLWPDFQPIALLRGGGGTPEEVRIGEDPLPNTDLGRAGVSPEAMERFRTLADCAASHGMGLIVGILTGWMSGRLFVPPALEGRSVLTDPFALMWEVRFVRCFVKAFKRHKAILAWDLGNETNCMQAVGSREAAWAWTATIAGTIRAEDPSRIVVSGMHSLSAHRKAAWSIQDQAELTDLLTTHPYPVFTPHCDRDPLDTIRPCLHATAESRFYADIGGNPCLAEEVGTLGPMVSGERVAANYTRTALYSLWAHDCHGLLWWCAYDQGELEHAPYDWTALERELGLIRTDRTVKPVLRELRAFGKMLSDLPFRTLPPRLTEAVCVVTESQDQWGAAYGSFVLAKQAGFDIEFQHSDQPLKDANLYLLPSVGGLHNFPRRQWINLLARVKTGATLYLSYGDAFLQSFKEAFGMEIRTRERRASSAEISMMGIEPGLLLHATAPIRLSLEPAGATVLGRESDGNPALARNRYGKGLIYFLSVPIETNLINQAGTFHSQTAQPWWKIYRHIAAPSVRRRAAAKDHPLLGVTEHLESGSRRIIVIVNYSPDAVKSALTLRKGWRIGKALRGKIVSSGEFSVPANDAIILRISR